MKAIFVLGLLVLTAHCGISLTGDFITGFESGIFMRNSPDAMGEYGCAEPEKKGGQFDQIMVMVGPVKMMMSSMQPDNPIVGMIDTVEVFLKQASSLLSVF